LFRTHRTHESLAAGAEQHGVTASGERAQIGEQDEVVDFCLAESDPRIDDDALALDPGCFRQPSALDEKRPHLPDHILIVRIRLHRKRRALHVHQHQCNLALGGQREHPGVVTARGYIVDDRGADL